MRPITELEVTTCNILDVLRVVLLVAVALAVIWITRR